MAQQQKITSPAVVALAWIIVMIPLGWGLYQSITKSKPLFTLNGASAPATTSGTVPAK